MISHKIILVLSSTIYSVRSPSSGCYSLISAFHRRNQNLKDESHNRVEERSL